MAAIIVESLNFAAIVDLRLLNLSRALLTKFKVLDKDATSRDDLFDAFRFSLMFRY
jgi:hypothetical protein